MSGKKIKKLTLKISNNYFFSITYFLIISKEKTAFKIFFSKKKLKEKKNQKRIFKFFSLQIFSFPNPK